MAGKKKKAPTPTPAGKKKATKKKDDFKEPKIKWAKSQAKLLLSKDILDGEVPLQAFEKDGKTPTYPPLRDIYMTRPEFALYNYDNFSSRLSSLRATIVDATARAKDDEEAFQKYKQNHPPSEVANNGCIQWQGSEARELLLEDMEEGLHTTLGKMELWGQRPEYYEYFPLAVFRDKIYQEIRTAKYIYTCQVKGKLHKVS
jgi:hypothetical protein